MIFLISQQAELMGEKARKILKEDDVPTVFCFTKTTKKRESSEARAASSSKNIFIKTVYSEPSVCEDDVPVNIIEHKAMVDKSIDNTTKMATKSTQYQRQIKDQPAKKDDILKLKFMAKKKKTRGSATKTDLSFSPDSVVSFCVNNSQQNQEKKIK